jgi:hypothetical protein
VAPEYGSEAIAALVAGIVEAVQVGGVAEPGSAPTM